MKRWMLSAAMIAALAATAPAAYAKNTLRWASQGDSLTIDPHSQNEGPTTTASQQHYEALLNRDPNMVLEPSLALTWKTVNPTTWEFKLRQGVKFHGGEAFTADDVVFSINRALSPTSDFRNYIDSIAEVKKVDDFTVHIVTKGPNPILPNQLTSIFIMSKSWAEKNKVEKPQDYKNKEETFAVRNANGTGPYILKLREPGVRTVWEKNANWWGWKDKAKGPGNVDEIVYTSIKTANTRTAALLSGEIDFVLDPQLQDLDRIAKDPKLQVKQVAQIRSIFFGVDMGRAELRSSDVKGKNPFADKRVRQAIAAAIDVNTIRRVTMRNLSFPAGIITSPGVHGYTKQLDTPNAFNVETAKKLLKDAGYPNGFSVKLDCPNDRYNNDEQICQAVVAMLGKAGIKIQLDSQSKTLHFPKIQKRETDFYLLGWGVPTLDSHYVFNFLYQSKGSWNATGYANPKVDKLTADMGQEVDLKKRDAMIAETWKIVKDDMVYIPVHHQVIAWGLSKRVDMPIVVNDTPQFRWAKMTGQRAEKK
jgi:peptide/nickel transport system substrate-binding protein